MDIITFALCKKMNNDNKAEVTTLKQELSVVKETSQTTQGDLTSLEERVVVLEDKIDTKPTYQIVE